MSKIPSTSHTVYMQLMYGTTKENFYVNTSVCPVSALHSIIRSSLLGKLNNQSYLCICVRPNRTIYNK